ncbi:MAG: MotA/TolQ/ExbB proton channel family protein [Chthoniobacteraceae bacterium]
MSLLQIASFQSIYAFFAQGGFFMVLLLMCSFTAFSVIITRGLALRRDVVMPPIIAQEIEALQPEDAEGVAKLSRMVRNDISALANVAQVGLHHLNWPKLENMEAVQTRARHEIVRLESGLFVLEIIVGIAPLLGLLGAVSGLVGVFAAFGGDVNAQDPHGIAKGISEALSTTIVGLAIAIPSLIAHSYFSKKIENMASDMETLIAELLAKCYYQQEQRRTVARTGPPPLARSYAPPADETDAPSVEEPVS